MSQMSRFFLVVFLGVTAEDHDTVQDPNTVQGQDTVQEMNTVQVYDDETGVTPGKEQLVEFYAPWCGHCKRLAPEYDKAAELLPAGTLGKLDVENNRDAAAPFGVRGFPTLKMIDADNQAFGHYGGPRSAEAIVSTMKTRAECLAGENSDVQACQMVDGGIPTVDGDGLPTLKGGAISLDDPFSAKFLALNDKLDFAAMQGADTKGEFFQTPKGKAILEANQEMEGKMEGIFGICNPIRSWLNDTEPECAALADFKKEEEAGFPTMTDLLNKRHVRRYKEMSPKTKEDMKYTYNIPDRDETLRSPQGKAWLGENGDAYHAYAFHAKSPEGQAEAIAEAARQTEALQAEALRADSQGWFGSAFSYATNSSLFVPIAVGLVALAGIGYWVRSNFFGKKEAAVATVIHVTCKSCGQECPPGQQHKCPGLGAHDPVQAEAQRRQQAAAAAQTQTQTQTEPEVQSYFWLFLGLIIIAIGGSAAAIYAWYNDQNKLASARAKVLEQKWDVENPEPRSSDEYSGDEYSESRGSYASPEPRGSYANPAPRGSYANPEPRGSYASPEPRGSYASPEPRGSDASPEPRGSDASPEPRGSDASPDPRGSYASPEPRGSDANPEPRGSHASPEPRGSDASPEPPSLLQTGHDSQDSLLYGPHAPRWPKGDVKDLPHIKMNRKIKLVRAKSTESAQPEDHRRSI